MLIIHYSKVKLMSKRINFLYSEILSLWVAVNNPKQLNMDAHSSLFLFFSKN